mmetsp:Transcript_22662/g.57724  ORF Transcript_22662/g.57724 Transcript_22662/m.57724 type:complete len:231 (-) Transcript_22662:1399-2091(-)
MDFCSAPCYALPHQGQGSKQDLARAAALAAGAMAAQAETAQIGMKALAAESLATIKTGTVAAAVTAVTGTMAVTEMAAVTGSTAVTGPAGTGQELAVTMAAAGAAAMTDHLHQGRDRALVDPWIETGTMAETTTATTAMAAAVTGTGTLIAAQEDPLPLPPLTQPGAARQTDQQQLTPQTLTCCRTAGQLLHARQSRQQLLLQPSLQVQVQASRGARRSNTPPLYPVTRA